MIKQSILLSSCSNIEQTGRQLVRHRIGGSVAREGGRDFPGCEAAPSPASDDHRTRTLPNALPHNPVLGQGSIAPGPGQASHPVTARLPNLSRRHTDPAGTIGAAITSCAGVGGAVTICASHGSHPVALLIFGFMQIWGICELICRWRMKWRYAQLYDYLVRKAVDQPDNQHLRTLLVDIASTHLDDLGERLPVRKELE